MSYVWENSMITVWNAIRFIFLLYASINIPVWLFLQMIAGGYLLTS